jgi:hypothetical protein
MQSDNAAAKAKSDLEAKSKECTELEKTKTKLMEDLKTA